MFPIVCSFFFLLACNSSDQRAGHVSVDTAAIKNSIASAPVLSPEESIKKMRIEEGFDIKLVAAEPLVNSPVAMKFDEKGRIWVCEMQSYMPDTAGTGEEQPTGTISILEDTNKDGVMDTRKVFLDHLVLPRALCLIENGLLIAEPPNLWFVEINNDKPGRKTLVDSTYAAGGNPEHQANGLIRGLDNWIYSANCRMRYRKQGAKWLIERTHSRGQWGISQNNDGRLFYNNNSENLLGDYFMPGFGAANTNQKNIAGFEEKIVTDNRVYPIRPTPGVNRGYMKGVLDDSLRLRDFTAASGPVIYRGGLFGDEYQENAFVAEPAANLIKRNLLEEKGFQVSGKQAYEKKEFLASLDERFRPVTLYNGPDGALYVVDMYRGIIQHETYLTEYLKGEIISRKLTQPLNCGRIYKIVPKGKVIASTNVLPSDPDSLAMLLNNPNGWLRDKAQEIIVDKRLTQLAPSLRRNLAQLNNPVLVTHSLWTLEGLGLLQEKDILPLLNQVNWKLRAQALSALASLIRNGKTDKAYLPILTRLADQKDTLLAPYLAFLANSIMPANPVAANQLLLQLVRLYPDNVYVADAVISSIRGKEEAFAKQVKSMIADTSMAINKRLSNVINNRKNSNGKNAEALKKAFPKGFQLFNTVCQTCHGEDGNGIKSLAPPLNKSEWVVGNKNRLIPIVLYGLIGPVKVNDHVYKAPEINGEMPGIGNNKAFTDEDIAQVLSFIRSSWSNKAEAIKPADVTEIRKKYTGRQNVLTQTELNSLK
jgi:mono/diheme cytochrome c family protein